MKEITKIIKVDEQYHQKLKEYAERNQETMGNIIVLGLIDFIDRNKHLINNLGKGNDNK